MMAHAANRGAAAHRGRPPTADQAGPPDQSGAGDKAPPGPGDAEQAPRDDGLSRSIAFLPDKLHDAAAAHDRD